MIFSYGGTIYIVAKLIANDILNIVNLMHTFENLLLQNYSTVFLDITHKYSLCMCNKVCSNGGATYIIGQIIIKDNLNLQKT